MSVTECGVRAAALPGDAALPLGPRVMLPARVYENARLTADFAGTAGSPFLRRNFLEALTKIQSIQVDFHAADENIFLNFGPATDRETEAFQTVMVVPALPVNWEFSASERGALRRRTEDALLLIQSIDGDLCSAIQSIVGALLFARLDGYDGGSISSLQGAIWLAMPPDRSVEDFAETIVHEYVHQCLFLEDMVRSIFVDGEGRLGRDDGLVTSAILKIRRGYDKSFHSAAVALVLSRFYARLGQPAKAQSFLEPLEVTIAELTGKTQFLTENGLAVLSDLLSCFTAAQAAFA